MNKRGSIIEQLQKPHIHINLQSFGNPLLGDENDKNQEPYFSSQLVNSVKKENFQISNKVMQQNNQSEGKITQSSNQNDVNCNMNLNQTNLNYSEQDPIVEKKNKLEELDEIKLNLQKQEQKQSQQQYENEQKNSIQPINSNKSCTNDQKNIDQVENNYSDEQNNQKQTLEEEHNSSISQKQKLEKLQQPNNTETQQKHKQSLQKNKSVTVRKSKGATLQQHIIQKKSNKSSKMQRFVKKFISSRPIQWFLIFLIFLYTVLIFATMAFDDLDLQNKDKILDNLEIIELIILLIFTIEILLNSYSQGLKRYFRDKWLLFDAIVIAISIGLVLVSIYINYGESFKKVSGSIRGIFRFLRIFLLLRKVQTAKKIKTSSQVKTHAEQIIELLYDLRDQFEQSDVLQNIEWAIDIIRLNKIYETNLQEKNLLERNFITMAKVQNIEKTKNNQYIKRTSDLFKRKMTMYRDQTTLNFPMNTIPSNCLDYITEYIDENKFNCFDLERLSKGQELLYIMIYIFERDGLISYLDVTALKFVQFISRLQNLYLKNQYHTSLHAVDVVQTCNFFLKKCKFEEMAKLNQLEIISIYVAAACHDVGHPGVNNNFLINTENKLSILYNDQSVLENYHLATTFELLLQDEYNMIENLDISEQNKFREIIIDAVLATDMVRHFGDISKAKARLSSDDFDITGQDKQMCIDLIIHSADISNPTKVWDVCFEWAHRIMEEFWDQGDQEKELGLPVSYLCDRYTVNIAKTQQGFTDFVVRPMMEVIINFLPNADFLLLNLDNNIKNWKNLIEDYDKRLAKLQEIKNEIEEDNLKKEKKSQYYIKTQQQIKY